MVNLSVFDKCDGYLDSRTGTYDFRCRRYDAVIDVMQVIGFMEPTHTVADVAAGWTEFGHRLTERGFRGRYIPYDGAIDGKDLQHWVPPLTKIDVSVAIEFLEHVHRPELVAQTMFDKSQLVVVTTPNSAVVDTLAMDDDHVVALREGDLYRMGFDTVVALPLFTDDNDTLVAWKVRK